MDDKNLNTLIVLRNILCDEVFAAYVNWRNSGNEEDFAKFESKLIAHGAETDFCAYLTEKVLEDENAFAVCCAAGNTPSLYTKNAFMRDVRMIFGYAQSGDADGWYEAGKPEQPFVGDLCGESAYRRIRNFYKKYGYGPFIKYRAFDYENGELAPIKNPSPITLEQLKGYASEKAAIESNIVNFLRGLPYNNMLLYGDRGTGKSSTIHAMLNKYWTDGLRIVEINKENMLDLPKIRQKIIDNPLKFIIFIDDLSMNENDDKISGLKAALEGSVSGNTANTMIVATSNRRHIVKENFSDRDNSVHVNDSLQEQLSLSDRFGITVLFSSTDKAQYLEIIKSLAADEGIPIDDNLCAHAERWALVKGGRSPRRARQFIDLATSCTKKGVPIEF